MSMNFQVLCSVLGWRKISKSTHSLKLIRVNSQLSHIEQCFKIISLRVVFICSRSSRMSRVLLAETKGFPGGSDGKESVGNVKDPGLIRVRKIPLEKEMAIRSSILAWKIPWTEEPGELQSMSLQRVGYKWVTNTQSREEGMGMRWTKGYSGARKGSETKFKKIQGFE